MAVVNCKTTRELAVSSLYPEDVCVGGHTAIWGSFFDCQQMCWGYACCRSTERKAACLWKNIKDVATVPTTQSEENSAPPRSEWVARALEEERQVSSKLRPRSECASHEDFLSEFVLHWFHIWKKEYDDKVVGQTRRALFPLLEQLKKGTVPESLLRNIVAFAELATVGEFSKANDIYVEITIGKALWHSHLDLGEQRAHWGGGCNLRTMQKQVIEKDTKNASLFDTDPIVQGYVHALKRLLTHMQVVQPDLDPSKCGHVPPAPPDASELGLPVMRSFCDGCDGDCREPEFVEPSDPSFSRPSRGIAFGTESGPAHPFTGIGFARGC